MDPSEDVLEKYKQAGKIASDVREKIKRNIREDMLVIDVCEEVEGMIRERGALPAFPCNVSINDVAAHYTSSPQDKMTIPSNSLVKIDLGVHIDGYIADTATTISLGTAFEPLVKAAEAALEKAIEILRPGLSISKFGSNIQEVIRNHGFKPVSNLTGHQVGRYLIHVGNLLPNVHRFTLAKIRSGEVYGVEPFVTTSDAIGMVERGTEANIFRFLKQKSHKNPYAKKLQEYIRQNFRTLPFSERWLQQLVPPDKHKIAFSSLLSSHTIMSYPVFIEASRNPVAQAEHTILIVDEGCLVLT